MHRLSLLVGSVFVLALLLAAPPAGRAEDQTDEMVEILATQPLSLEEFLMVAGRYAGMPFLWDPGTRELARSQVTMARSLRVTRGGLFELIRTVLASYDLVLLPMGGEGYEVYRVIAVGDLGGVATLQPRVIELDGDNVETYRAQHGVLVTTTLRTRHLDDLESVRPALMAHATRGGVGRIEVLPEIPGFAVTDFAPAVVAIRDALQQIDTPPPEPRHPARVTTRIDLVHADAEETAAGLAAHFGANLLLPGREDLTPTLRVAPILGLRILTDERTNALLVSGSHDRVGEVREAVTLLDVPAEVQPTWVHVYRLKNLQAVPTARVLRELAAESVALRAGEDAPTTTIVADAQTNALLLEATPRVYEQFVAILQELDKPAQDDEAER